MAGVSWRDALRMRVELTYTIDDTVDVNFRLMKQFTCLKSMELQMILVFRRIGQRRYAVEAKRAPFPDVEMNPAPGYDERMPHDLMHLVVEAQLGLKRGVFGQLAAGGDAGTFHPSLKPNESLREAARVRRRLKTRGKTLLRDGRDESAQSERATYICWYEWLARSKSSDRRAAAQAMAQQARQVRDVASATELHALSERKLEEICQHLDELSSQWSRLEVGQSMAVRWPDLAVSTSPAVLASD
jgi:hypothetical protein